MRLLLALLLSTCLAVASTHSPGEPFSSKERAQRYSDRVILAKPHPRHRATVEAAEATEGVHVRNKFARFGDLRVIELPASETVEKAIRRLEATGRYEFVEPDYLETPDATPNDASFATQWPLNNTGQLAGSTPGVDIKAVAAWDIIREAPNVVVAVIDNGFNLTHRDLVPNLWRNPAPTFGDVNGASFVRGARSGNVADETGHGSHVAGIIGAAGNNTFNISGIAWRVQLMAVKNSDATGSSASSDSAACIDYAVAHGARIINCSFGGTSFSQTLFTALRAARDAGVIVVTSAGNDGFNSDTSPHYPSGYLLDNVVSVGSSGPSDLASSSSDVGGLVDLFAPGTSILSLDLTNTGQVTRSGTSMAAPHVTGSLALLRAHFPNDTPRQLINRLFRGVDRGPGFTGRAHSGGRLNLLRALTGTSNRPFNDEFENRAILVGGGATLRANNAGATAEAGEPAHAGVAASSTLWWQWTAPSGGAVTVTTRGSDYDTVLGVYTGGAVNALTRVAANDDSDDLTTSRLTFTAELGVTYYFAVGGKNGATGLTVLGFGTAPANDDFANAEILPSQQSLQKAGTTVHATMQTGEPRILDLPGGVSVWYRWTAPRTGRFQVAAFSLDADLMLGVYTGSSVDALTLVASNDDTGVNNVNTDSLCTFVATAGTAYYLKVDAKDSLRPATFTLTVTDSLWQFSTDGGAISGSPTVAPDGTIFQGAGAPDPNLYAIAPDGTFKWLYRTNGSIAYASPAIGRDGTIFLGASDGRVTALKPDGKVLWERALGAGSVSVSPAIGNDGVVYLHGTDGFLYSLDPATGATRWRVVVNALSFASAAIGPDGTIYQASEAGFLYAIRPDGTQKWRFTTNGDTFSTPAIDASGNIYVTTYSTATLLCVTPAGSLRWQFSSPGEPFVSSSPTLSADGGAAYFGASDNRLYAVNTADGSQRWRVELEDAILTSTAAIDANGTIYVGCYDNRIYAINPNGTIKRTWDTALPVRSSPTIAGRTLYIGSTDAKLYALEIDAPAANGAWTQYRQNASHTGRLGGGPLALTVTPQPVSTVISLPFTLGGAASGTDPIGFQWRKDGVVIPGATYATHFVTKSTASDAGSYTLTVTNAQGTLVTAPVVVTLESLIPPRVSNFSVRSAAGAAAQTMTVAFRVGPGAAKPLLIRGIGPTLATFGVAGALADPQLQLLSGATLIVANDNWAGDAAVLAAASRANAFPLVAASRDAAVVRSLAPGSYGVQLSGVNNTTGVTLAEIYDTDSVTSEAEGMSRLTNLSARALVGTGENVFIAGFTVVGNVPKTLLIRAIGPGLASFGVTGAISDPILEVFRGATVIGRNDEWGGTTALRTAFAQAGAFPIASSTSSDSALTITLTAGVYTARITGFLGVTGVALLEIYELP